MCPACIANMTLIAGGTMSSGGLTAFMMSKFCRKKKTNQRQMDHPEIVSETEWLVARKDLLAREKEFSRQRDALSAARRQLPMVKIDKEYVFDGPKGKETLAGLFDGRSQLIVYHFMFGPGWEEGCKSFSYLADHFDGA